jgi:tetratricopeptide (TPR) repeat protein
MSSVPEPPPAAPRPLDQPPDHPLDRFVAEFRQAVEACRTDNWRLGYEILTRLAPQAGPKDTLPGVFYSYLGVAVARCEGRRHDGVELARYALRLQPREPDNYCNMALLSIMLGRRSEALRWIEKGLRYEPRHRRLLEVRESLGVRRRPPVPFLPRANPVNVLLGQLRHHVEHWRDERREQRQERLEIEQAAEAARPRRSGA